MPFAGSFQKTMKPPSPGTMKGASPGATELGGLGGFPGMSMLAGTIDTAPATPDAVKACTETLLSAPPVARATA